MQINRFALKKLFIGLLSAIEKLITDSGNMLK